MMNRLSTHPKFPPAVAHRQAHMSVFITKIFDTSDVLPKSPKQIVELGIDLPNRPKT
jgi:hypothetical protein